MSGFDPKDPASYRFWSVEYVRFADLDMLGHVNNKAYLTYYESGRIDYMRSRAALGEPRINLALVRLEIDFLHEIQYPATLKIGIRLLKLGRSSLTKACALFNGDVCCSTSVSILVCFDPVARASKPFSDAQRKLLEADL